MLVIVGAITDVALARNALKRCAQSHLLADWHVERAFAGKAVVVLEAGHDIALDFTELGLDRKNVERTACRIATVEGALWPLEHFDTLKVIEGASNVLRACREHAVEVLGDCRVAVAGRCEIARTANVDLQGAAALRDLDARRKAGDVSGLGNAGARQRLSRQDVDRDCRPLGAFPTELCRHDDFVSGRLCGLLLGRCGPCLSDIRHHRSCGNANQKAGQSHA